MFFGTAYLPENLNLETILNNNPPPFKYRIDKFQRIGSLLTEIPANNKELLSDSGFVPINAQILQSSIHDYSRYLTYFIENTIMETDNQYIKGQKSKCFRFTDQFQTPITPVVIDNKRYIQTLNTLSKYEIRMIKKYYYLFKWFNDDLNIDFPKANEYIWQQLKNNRALHIENALLKFNSYFLNIDRFNKKNFYFIVDTSVSRLHTNIVVMKSELRNFISYGGKNLVSIDMSNSQPYLSTVLLNETFWKKEIFAGNLNIYSALRKPHLLKQVLSEKSINNILSYIMLVRSAESIDNSGFEQYIHEAANGTLYQYINRQFEIISGHKIRDKKKLKEIIFRVLYTDNRFIGQREAEPKRIFRAIFPEVYELFKLLKKTDSTLLPRLLQTIESKMMLDVIAKRIAKEKPNMPLFTVHDSIVCPVGNENYCAKVIKEEMKKAIGIEPSLKFEYWSPENLKN